MSNQYLSNYLYKDLTNLIDEFLNKDDLKFINNKIKRKNICKWAATNSYLSLLQWARAQNPPCPWSQQICIQAAKNNHLILLQWARSQNPPCPWITFVCIYAA